MLTEYAKDEEISSWQPWQRDYRFGLLLIFPPEPPASEVNALRARHDPRSQVAIGAHITLTVPFPGALTEVHWQELERIASKIAPLGIRYGPLRHYLPYPGVTLAIEPQGELEGILAALGRASVFAGAKPRPYPFSAHMTIAEFITAEETESLMTELKDVAPQGAFLCSHVSYAVPDRGFHFTERGRLDLLGRLDAPAT